MESEVALDREDALGELSTAHAVALRLRDSGADNEEIATALGVPVEGIGTLLEVAQLKLSAIWPGEAAAEAGPTG